MIFIIFCKNLTLLSSCLQNFPSFDIHELLKIAIEVREVCSWSRERVPLQDRERENSFPNQMHEQYKEVKKLCGCLKARKLSRIYALSMIVAQNFQ